jgi:hypothetical protein
LKEDRSPDGAEMADAYKGAGILKPAKTPVVHDPFGF